MDSLGEFKASYVFMVVVVLLLFQGKEEGNLSGKLSHKICIFSHIIDILICHRI